MISPSSVILEVISEVVRMDGYKAQCWASSYPCTTTRNAAMVYRKSKISPSPEGAQHEHIA